MRFSTLAFSVLILTIPAGAFAQGHGFFTPEQRYMYMQEQKAGGTDWHSMTPDQRHAQMQAIRAKFDAMSDADKAKLKAGMQAKFDALTPQQKQLAEQKIAEREARRQQRREQRQQQSAQPQQQQQ